MTILTLDKLLTNIFDGLGYSNKLTQKAFEDLEKIIVFRFYITVSRELENPPKLNIKNMDIENFIELAKKELSQKQIDQILLKTTEEVVGEYLKLVSDAG